VNNNGYNFHFITDLSNFLLNYVIIYNISVSIIWSIQTVRLGKSDSLVCMHACSQSDDAI